MIYCCPRYRRLGLRKANLNRIYFRAEKHIIASF